MHEPRRGVRGAALVVAPLVALGLAVAACGGDPPIEDAFDPAAPAVEPAAAPTPLQGLRYEVRPGDTLWDIARRHDTTPAEIVQASGDLVDPDRLDVGDVVTIPPPGPPPIQPSATPAPPR